MFHLYIMGGLSLQRWCEVVRCISISIVDNESLCLVCGDAV